MRLRLAHVLALLVVVAPMACGDDDGGTGDRPDASNIDAAPPVDAAPAADTCGIQLAYEGQVVGLLVAFNRPDGSLIGTAITDVDGKASRDDCVADTMVSMVRSFGFGRASNQFIVFTVAGVQPGDTVVVGADGGGPPDPSSIAIVSSPTNVSSGVGYELTNGCGWNEMSPGNDVPLPLSSSCRGRDPSNFDVIAVSRDNSAIPPWDITSYAAATNVPIVVGDDSPATLGAWTAVTAPTKIDVTLTNPPALAAEVTANLSQRRDGVAFTQIPSGFLYPGGPMSFTHSGALPHAFFEGQSILAQVDYGYVPVFGSFPLPATGQSATMLYRGVAPTDTMEVDLSAMLPRLAGLYMSAPQGISRPTVSWLTDSSPEEAHGIMLMFAYGPGFPDPDNISVKPRGVWMVLTSDVASGELTAPVLPDVIAAAAPQANEVPAPILGWMFASEIQSYQEFITSGLPINGGLFVPGLGEWPPNEYEAKGSVWYGQSFYSGDGCLVYFNPTCFDEDP